VGTATAPNYALLLLQEGLEYSFKRFLLVALVLAMEDCSNGAHWDAAAFSQ
jgi:hypothetical protein